MEVTPYPHVHLQTGLRNPFTYFLFIFLKSTSEHLANEAPLLLGQVPRGGQAPVGRVPPCPFMLASLRVQGQQIRFACQL
jgi:hypothetical protein